MVAQDSQSTTPLLPSFVVGIGLDHLVPVAGLLLGDLSIEVCRIYGSAIAGCNICYGDHSTQVQSAVVDAADFTRLELARGYHNVHDKLISLPLELGHETVVQFQVALDIYQVSSEACYPLGFQMGQRSLCVFQNGDADACAVLSPGHCDSECFPLGAVRLAPEFDEQGDLTMSLDVI